MTDPEQSESVQSADVATPRMPFWLEVWCDFRPYALCFIKDWLIGASFYLLQKAYELLGELAPLKSWSGDVVANEHAVGTVAAFALFIGLLIKDVLQIQRSRK